MVVVIVVAGLRDRPPWRRGSMGDSSDRLRPRGGLLVTIMSSESGLWPLLQGRFSWFPLVVPLLLLFPLITLSMRRLCQELFW